MICKNSYYMKCKYVCMHERMGACVHACIYACMRAYLSRGDCIRICQDVYAIFISIIPNSLITV